MLSQTLIEAFDIGFGKSQLPSNNAFFAVVAAHVNIYHGALVDNDKPATVGIVSGASRNEQGVRYVLCNVTRGTRSPICVIRETSLRKRTMIPLDICHLIHDRPRGGPRAG